MKLVGEMGAIPNFFLLSFCYCGEFPCKKPSCLIQIIEGKWFSSLLKSLLYDFLQINMINILNVP
jgi:hypothetical protein